MARCLQHWDAVWVGGIRAHPHLLLLMGLLLTHPLWRRRLLLTVRQRCRKIHRLLCRQQHEGSLAVTELMLSSEGRVLEREAV